VTGLDLVSEAARVAEQAAALLSAPECPAARAVEAIATTLGATQVNTVRRVA